MINRRNFAVRTAGTLGALAMSPTLTERLSAALSLSETIDRILEVTPQQVAAVAARHLQPDRAVAVIVADRGAVEADLRARHIGEIMLTEIEA